MALAINVIDRRDPSNKMCHYIVTVKEDYGKAVLAVCIPVAARRFTHTLHYY